MIKLSHSRGSLHGVTLRSGTDNYFVHINIGWLLDVKIRGMEVEGLSGLREPDGTINLQDKVQENVKSDGKKHREGFFVS
jgi:hypothetical protein